MAGWETHTQQVPTCLFVVYAFSFLLKISAK